MAGALVIRVFAIVGSILVAIIAIQTHRLKGETRKNARLEIQLATANAQHEADVAARARDDKVAAELATIREQTKADFRAFDETLRTSKVTREIRYVTKDGVQAVCTERDPVPFRLRFNEAVSGAASP